MPILPSEVLHRKPLLVYYPIFLLCDRHNTHWWHEPLHSVALYALCVTRRSSACLKVFSLVHKVFKLGSVVELLNLWRATLLNIDLSKVSLCSAFLRTLNRLQEMIHNNKNIPLKGPPVNENRVTKWPNYNPTNIKTQVLSVLSNSGMQLGLEPVRCALGSCSKFHTVL